MANPKDGSEMPEKFDPRNLQTKNISSSTAGASSGDFHVYRQERRTELARIERMEREDRKQKEAEALFKAAEERRLREENKTAKRAAKRKRKKELRDSRKKVRQEVRKQEPDKGARVDNSASGDAEERGF